MKDERIYQLALTLIPNIGSVHIKKLLEHFETPKDIFNAQLKELKSLENIGESRAKDILEFKDFGKAEQELIFAEKHDIDIIFYKDANYPNRLKDCFDPPTLLFSKGNMQLNAKKTVAIVGTRNNSSYGKKITEELVESLKSINDVLVVSGLAFGIDAIAHNASLAQDIPTVGVLGHGLGSIYPYQHKSLAEEMMENGGILSELFHDTAPDRYNFPKRNRIVAGMTDVTIVIETGKKGGSIITANLANDYNKDVFAVPGRTTDEKSEGCNWLIAQKRAELFCSPKEFLQFMNWDGEKSSKKAKQRLLFQDFDENESVLVKILEEKEAINIDELAEISELSQGRIASVLLNLELKGVIESLPGKRYSLL